MLHKSALLLTAWIIWVTPLAAKPAQVILIRHADEPAEGHDLSLRGRERAAAFVPFFQGNDRVLEFGTPVAVYALPPSENHKSRRSVQTVQGLAEALKLKVIDKFTDEGIAKLVEEIMTKRDYDGKMVLICWRHHFLPELARAFGVKDPPKWHGDTYDRLWVITFKKDGAVRFSNLPQKLLYGDSAE